MARVRRNSFEAISSAWLSRLFLWGWLLCTMLPGAPLLRAQELVRSAAEKPAIASFRNPEAFFHIGPLEELLTGSIGVQYTDNVELTNTDKISDFSIFQALDLDSTWVISQLNQLHLKVGGQLTENFYGNGKSSVNFAVSPDSLIQFQFEISNFLIRLYNQFSYVQNPTSNPTATNTANLNSLTNTVGASVESDLGVALLSLFADYTYNDQTGATAQNQTNAATTGTRSSFRTGPTLTFNWSPAIAYGINPTATRSTGSNSANVNSLNVGPFIKGKLSPEFDFDLDGGATLIDTKPSLGPNYYFDATARYQLNRNWQLILSASHELLFTTGTDITEQTTVQVASRLALTRFITLTATPFINFGDEKTTQAAVSTSEPGWYTQYGLEASLAWKMRKRWSSALTYDFTRREARMAANTYVQNLFAFSITYAF